MTTTRRSAASAADWHRARRAAILKSPAGDAVRALSKPSRTTLLVSAGMQLFNLALAAWCALAELPIWAILVLAYGPGAWCAMARFAMLHEIVHGVAGGRTKRIRHLLLRIADLPSVTIVNYLYYRWGHIDHHRRLGRDTAADVDTATSAVDLDILFQLDTMRLRRKPDEAATAPGGWRGSALLNLARISALQVWNNIVDTVALPFMVLFGPPFMRQRGRAFIRDLQIQAAIVCAQMALLHLLLGWQALLYLLLAQIFLYIPIHPFFAYFSATHGASETEARLRQPTTSIDAGRWFTVATFALDHHVEHHDFPNIPWHRLPTLRRLAPDFYPATHRHRGALATIARAMRTAPLYAGQGLDFELPQPALPADRAAESA